MWANNKARSEGLFPTWMRESIGPLMLIFWSFPSAFLMVHAMNKYDGDMIFGLGKDLMANLIRTLQDAYVMPDAVTVKILAVFAVVQLAMMKLVPGNRFEGPTTATGHVPVYNANGLQVFFLTIYGYLAFSKYFIGNYLPEFAQYEADILYHQYPQIISFMSVFAFIFCLGLYAKGLVAPSSTDHGSSGNPVIDFYWGTELYPRIFGWDVKMFTNCRFGMMMWGLLPIAFAAHDAKQGITNAMAVNLVLNLVYVAKVRKKQRAGDGWSPACSAQPFTSHATLLLQFFWWEAGYLRTIDIMHDRAGYYICWGCLVWVPVSIPALLAALPLLTVVLSDPRPGSPLERTQSRDCAGMRCSRCTRVYLPGPAAHACLLSPSLPLHSQSLYVSHSYFVATQRDKGLFNAATQDLSFNATVAIIAAGFLMVLINYDADRQRAYVRTMDGACDVWGSPAKVIRAKYTVELPNGKKAEKSALLLASGWWGLSRHFHYVPEILAAFFWSLPAAQHLYRDAAGGILGSAGLYQVVMGAKWFLPFFYVIFLTVLLFDRAYRDSARCASKYGKYYEQYKAQVPSLVIPYVW